MKTRVVVTGGAGFIGSHVAERFLELGSAVLIVDDLSTGLQKNIDSIHARYGEQVNFLCADIGSQTTFEAICKFQPTLVFHLAAQANVRKSVADPLFDAKTNVLGMINLLEASRVSGVKGFIFSSTGGAIYGEQDTFPAAENHKTTPECPYGVSKRCGEVYLEYYARTAAFFGIVLRYANVFGPRQNPKGEAGVVAVFTDRLLAGKNLVVNGDGEQTRDFVHVADVVQANELAGKAILEGKSALPKYSVFNVGRGKEISVNDIVKSLRTAWPQSAVNGQTVNNFEVSHGPASPGEQRRSVVDNAKIRKELGWEPKVEFTQGLLETIKSFRQAV